MPFTQLVPSFDHTGLHKHQPTLKPRVYLWYGHAWFRKLVLEKWNDNLEQRVE